MIRAFTANYIKFEYEDYKRSDAYLVIEILPKKLGDKQLIVMNKNHLVLATVFETIVDIKGFHQYKPVKDILTNFGIGGLSPLKTNHPSGMLEGLALQTGMTFKHVATAFGQGLLESINDYSSFVE